MQDYNTNGTFELSGASVGMGIISGTQLTNSVITAFDGKLRAGTVLIISGIGTSGDNKFTIATGTVFTPQYVDIVAILAEDVSITSPGVDVEVTYFADGTFDYKAIIAMASRAMGVMRGAQLSYPESDSVSMSLESRGNFKLV